MRLHIAAYRCNGIDETAREWRRRSNDEIGVATAQLGYDRRGQTVELHNVALQSDGTAKLVNAVAQPIVA